MSRGTGQAPARRRDGVDSPTDDRLSGTPATSVGRGCGGSSRIGDSRKRFSRKCVELGAEVKLLTPGASYPPFVERYSTPGVTFQRIPFDTAVSGSGRKVAWERRIGRRLVRQGLHRARAMLWRQIGARLAAADAGPMMSMLDESPPDVFVATDVNMGFGRGLVGACQRRGDPDRGQHLLLGPSVLRAPVAARYADLLVAVRQVEAGLPEWTIP